MVCERVTATNLIPKLRLVFILSTLDLPSNSKVKAHANAMCFDLLVRVSLLNCPALLSSTVLQHTELESLWNSFAPLWPACCPRISQA